MKKYYPNEYLLVLNYKYRKQDKVNMQDVYSGETEKPSEELVKFLYEVIRTEEHLKQIKELQKEMCVNYFVSVLLA